MSNALPNKRNNILRLNSAWPFWNDWFDYRNNLLFNNGKRLTIIILRLVKIQYAHHRMNQANLSLKYNTEIERVRGNVKLILLGRPKVCRCCTIVRPSSRRRCLYTLKLAPFRRSCQTWSQNGTDRA